MDANPFSSDVPQETPPAPQNVQNNSQEKYVDWANNPNLSRGDLLKELKSLKEEGNNFFRDNNFNSAIERYQMANNFAHTVYKGLRELLSENSSLKENIPKNVLDSLREDLNWHSFADVDFDEPSLESLLSTEQRDVLAEAYNQSEEDEETRTDFCLSLVLNSALCHIRLKKFQNAIKACDRALEMDPTSVKALLRRSKSYEGVGRYDLARKDIEKLQQLDPDSPVAKDAMKSFEKELEKQRQRERNSFKGILNSKKRKAKSVTQEKTVAAKSSFGKWAALALGAGTTITLSVLALRWFRSKRD